METTNITKYQINLFEGIAAKIVKMLAMKKIMKTIDDAKELVEEDPTIQARMDSIKHNYAQLDKELESFCRRNPDSYMCKRRTNPAARWK